MNLLQMAGVWWRLRLGKPLGLSIDITDRCPLSCAGCYMKWYGPNEDLPLPEWERIVQGVPARERSFCAWTGGEPLLRADDVRVLSRHFRWNWVATNGTVPIPDIPRMTAFVSVDGPQEVHDSLRPRGDSGSWREVVRNVTPACYIACTLRRENSDAGMLRELVAFWRGRARGVVFGFVTPRRGEEGGTLSPAERERAVEQIRALRREHGRFVMGVGGQLDDCASTRWLTGAPGERCPAAATLVAFDARGERKRPCTLGGEVDCSRCGCAVPGFLRRVRRFHVRTLVEVSRLFRSPRDAGAEHGPRPRP